jgi:hypothetical protein
MRGNSFPLALALLALAGCISAWAGGDLPEDLLTLDHGAVLLAHTGQYDDEFPANALIDGRLRDYWASGKRQLRGFHRDSFIIELDRPYLIQRLVVDNRDDDEMQYPGISAREVRFEASTQSHTGPWKPVATVMGKKFGRAEKVLERPVPARWLKVTVLSNHGHKLYTEISELEAYGQPLQERPPHEMQPDGVYQTNYGPLLLKVKGGKVEGCYELDKGYVYGTTDGRVFHLNWIEHRGEERGTAVLVLSSTGFLNGLWYERGNLSGTWFGNKLGSEARIDCDPVTAAAGVGFQSGKLISEQP